MLSKKLLVLATTACLVSCTGASAMSQARPVPNQTPLIVRPVSDAPANSPVAPATSPITVVGNDFEKGYALGSRNGGLLVDRLKQRTTDELGCDGIDMLEKSLIKVTRSLRAPAQGTGRLTAGFYSGYLAQVRNTLREIRQGCEVLDYSTGEFAGELFGAIACQSQSVSIEVLSELELQPLYTGWSGGSSDVQLGCLTTLTSTVTACTDGAELSTEIEALLSVSCSDPSSEI